MNAFAADACRALAPADAAEAAALIRRAFAAQPVATDPPSSALRETEASVAAQIAAGGGVGALSEDAALVALLLWAERDGGLYCGRLAVVPERRGRGLARRLVAEAEREARRRGLPRLWVKVRLALDGNRALFAACGFRETGREAHPGFAAPTYAVLEKILDASTPLSGPPRAL